MHAARHRWITAATLVGLLALEVVPGPAPADAATPVGATVQLDATVGVLATTVIVEVTDAAGQPVAGTPVTVTRTTADGTTPVAIVVTDAQGRAATSEPVGVIGPAATYRARLAGGTMAVETVQSIPGPVVPSASAPDRAPLGDRLVSLGGFVGMAVDDAHRRVFVSTGTELVGFDADGTRIGTVAGAGAAGALVMSDDDTTLFTIVGAEPTVTVIDTATMAEVGSLPLPGVVGWVARPRTLVRAADRLVALFSRTGRETVSVGTVPLADPSSGVISTVELSPVFSATYIDADPRHPRLVLGSDLGPTFASEWDVSGTPRQTRSSTFPPADNSGNLSDLRFSDDGADLFVAAGAPYHPWRLDPDTWAIEATYPIGAYPMGIAPTRDGAWVATHRQGYGPSAEVWDRSGTVLIGSMPPPGGNGHSWFVEGVLEFSGDSSRLYAVRASGPYDTGPVSLQVWANPLAACSIALDASLDADGVHLGIHGSVTSAGGPVGDTAVAVDVSGVGPLGDLVTSASGSLSTSVVLPAVAAAVTVTVEVTVPGGVAPCRRRVEVTRPAPRVPDAPVLVAALGLRGGVVAWWNPPLSTGGRPITAYSMIVVDTNGLIRAWVNTGAAAFVAGAALPPGTYEVHLVAWNALGAGHAAVGRRLTVT